MIYTLKEARKGTGKRDSVIEWYFSKPSELTFENYKNSKFWVEQPKSSWTSTLSLLKRGQLNSKKAKEYQNKRDNIADAPRKSDKILHGKLTHTWGADSNFEIEDFIVSYTKENGKPSVFEADFNYVDLDELNRMLTHNSVGEVERYLMKNSNTNLKVRSEYSPGKDCGDLETLIFKAQDHFEVKEIVFKRK